MGPFRLKVAESDFEELRRLCFAYQPREAGAFALAGWAERGSGTGDLLVRRPVPVPPGQFRVQQEYRLEVSPRAINGLASLCEANGLSAVICHSHPEDIEYSMTDDFGERRLAEALRPFLPEGVPMGSLLFLPHGIRGRVWLPEKSAPMPLSEVVVVGPHLRRILLTEEAGGEVPVAEMYDRQVRAFGPDGQALLASTKVGIVGVGGTGSPTAEQLIRMGVTDLVLIDPKDFQDSNLTRVYGSFTEDLGSMRKKVEIVAEHLRRIRPEVRIRTAADSVVDRAAAQAILDRDVIFLCTDDHWGRSVVNDIAYQYLIPTINLGSRIASNEGTISAAIGAVDVLRPDMPCLWCSQFLRTERIAAESMPESDRRTLAQEGYVEGLDTPAPSVIGINTALAGHAVMLFLQFVTGFMGESGAVARLRYDAMDGTVRRGNTTVADQCMCRQARGYGDLKPLNTVSSGDMTGLSR